MKKILVCLIMAIFLLSFGVIAASLVSFGDFVIAEASEYPLTTVVVEIDEENDIVSVIDFTGNCWGFYGVEDWMVGDICSIIMDDHGTPFNYDDIILAIRYGGYIDGNWGRGCDGVIFSIRK